MNVVHLKSVISREHTVFGKNFLPNKIISFSIFLVIGRLTWLVYIIGAVIGGRVSFTSVEEHDGLDGQLVCR